MDIVLDTTLPGIHNAVFESLPADPCSSIVLTTTDPPFADPCRYLNRTSSIEYHS